MFGQNEIVGRSFFKDAPTNQLFVTSLFFTIQGEGPFRGEPAFFVRLAKCNLACDFCDTFFDQGQWMSFEEIDIYIEQIISNHFKGHVPAWATHDSNCRKMVLVVTGGEPALQSTALANFFNHMYPQFAKMQVETNGTMPILLPNSDKTHIVVSPKCNLVNKYIQPSLEVLTRADCLKFVMCADHTSPYSRVPEWANKWAQLSGKPIYVSPMNVYNDLPSKAKQMRANNEKTTLAIRSTTDEVISFWEPGLLNMKANQANHEYTAHHALQYGYIFNMQMHLFASMA